MKKVIKSGKIKEFECCVCGCIFESDEFKVKEKEERSLDGVASRVGRGAPWLSEPIEATCYISACPECSSEGKSYG